MTLLLQLAPVSSTHQHHSRGEGEEANSGRALRRVGLREMRDDLLPVAAAVLQQFTDHVLEEPGSLLVLSGHTLRLCGRKEGRGEERGEGKRRERDGEGDGRGENRRREGRKGRRGRERIRNIHMYIGGEGRRVRQG